MGRQDFLLKELIAALSMMPVCTQGDDYVDWVGMSLYHFGTTFPYDQNVLPEAQKFTATVSLLLACWQHALHALLGISVHTLSCCCCPCLTSQHRSCLTQWNDFDHTACCACFASKYSKWTVLSRLILCLKHLVTCFILHLHSSDIRGLHMCDLSHHTHPAFVKCCKGNKNHTHRLGNAL